MANTQKCHQRTKGTRLFQFLPPLHPGFRIYCKTTNQFELEVDASGYAVGAVLLQRKEDGKKHPLGYYSATLNEAQRNYDIYDLELLAIVMALKNWRPLLAGSPHKIIIYSDHLNLQYWRLPQRISRRVAREVLELSEYDFEIRHLPGRLNTHCREDQGTIRGKTTTKT